MDPRLSRSHSDHDRTKPQSPNRGDPRLRTQEPPQPQQPPHWPHPLAQMPQTHYTIGDGLTTYQHLVPSAATAIYPPAAPPGPYAQYPGYAAPTAYQAYPAYAAYYTPAPPPQHIEQQQHATSYQQPPQMPGTYAPQGAPQGSWAPARMSEQVPVQVQTPITAYMQQQQQQAASTATVPPSSDIAATTKQEGVEQEMQQTQAEMRRQRDDFERRAALLSRELEQLKKQKRELKQQLQQQNGDSGTPSKDRETVSILKDNTKLQMEIQSKLKELANRVDLLSGILGDRKTKSSHRSSSSGKERERSKHHRERERSSSEHRSGRTRSSRDRERSPRDKSAGGDSTSSSSGSSQSDGANNTTANSSTQHQLPDMTATVQYNYVHYDPEVHWCRICDAFPRTAKDLLQHLHDDDHRQLMQAENIEIPWHKLPSQDKEFPFREGATKRRVPIKGLQFFVSAPAWYCRLCDTWIGDLHCASQHLKSIGHTQNYANFVDQNPKWEKEWLEDRKKALERCSSNVVSDKKANPALDLAGIEQKAKTVTSMSSMQFDKKKNKKSKKSKKNKSSTKKGKKRRNSKKLSDDSSGTSTSTSTTSSSDDSSSDENDDGVDKSKSIRVAMRNQVMKSSSAMMDEQIMILENLVKEKKRLQQQEFEIHAEVQSRAAGASSDNLKQSNTDDRLISQWMNVDQAGNKLSADGSIEEKKDKYLLDSLKDRLKQKQDKEQRARLFQQQQQQMEEEQARRKEREETEGKQREEMEERERRDREAREGMAVNSSSREQVKFRQFRGGKATTAQRRRSNEASPTTSSSPKNNRSSHRSRSRSSSSERRRGRGRGERERRYSHQRHGGYRGRRSSRSRSRTTSPPRSNTSSKGKNEVIKDKEDPEKEKKHVPTTPGVPQRKLPFIGRMPLFKNRKLAEDQQTKTSTAKTDNQQQQDLLAEASGDAYEMPRQSRFQPGNLARAFIPQPDVVHYPKLTTQPVVQLPPTPPVLPDPPRISVPQPPPPPNIQPTPKPIVGQYQHAELKQHQEVYEYTEAEFDSSNQQHHEMEHDTLPPLPPSMLMPPLPPPPPKLQYGLERGKGGEDFDDLAMLGISSDDMAAQVF